MSSKNGYSGDCRSSAWATLLALWALFVIACVMPSGAQITSTLEGTVTDQQGFMVPGAEIHVVNKELAIDRTVTGDESGHFRVAGLPAGNYQIEVAKTGFETKIVQRLETTVNQTVTANIVLAVGSVRSEVEVNANAPLLETNTTSTGSTITPRQIEDMPINGRNYLDLLQLVPGVTLNRQADEGTDAAVPILGQRGNNTQDDYPLSSGVAISCL